MSDQEIRDRLSRRADEWCERRCAEEAMYDASRRHDRNIVTAIFAGGVCVVLLLAGLLYLAAGGGK